MLHYSQTIYRISLLLLFTCCLVACKKLVAVDEPIDSITAEKMFRNEAQAEGALAGIYNAMIHGPALAPGMSAGNAVNTSFAAGLSTVAGGLSSGELITSTAYGDAYMLYTNKLTLTTSSYADNCWRSAYHVIYNANSVIEGIANVQGGSMRDSVKAQYTAEAKFLRAFAYFYLVNLYGDVPLALTVDFNKTAGMQRSPVTVVYAQIQRDLEDAERDLPATYAAGKGLRVRANKWAAKAILARLHLYNHNDALAAAKASEVIGQQTIYQLEPLNSIFLKNSQEAIFQLMQTEQDPDLKNATPEGAFFIPDIPHEGHAPNWLSAELLNAFEPGDLRKESWTDSTLQTQNGLNTKVWYPTKYKTGRYNSFAGMPADEYYVVLRLAELYLIRAEARANGADGGHAKAIEDLNAIRARTSLQALPSTLDAAAVKAAVAHERSIELFAEWGHRWMDLKRTGKASAVLSAMPSKQPWTGDYQLLYPIPVKEIESNRQLAQNPGYIQ